MEVALRLSAFFREPSVKTLTGTKWIWLCVRAARLVQVLDHPVLFKLRHRRGEGWDDAGAGWGTYWVQRISTDRFTILQYR